MSIDILTTNIHKLKVCTDKNKKREQEKKDERSRISTERNIKKVKYKHKKQKDQDKTIKKYKKLINESTSSGILSNLEESLIGKGRYYSHYIQQFFPGLNGKILSYVKEKEIRQVTSEATHIREYFLNIITDKRSNYRTTKDIKLESRYSMGFEYDCKVKINPRVVNNSIRLLEAIESQNDSKFRKYLKNKKGKGIVCFIPLLKMGQKPKFLNAIIKTIIKENSVQIVLRAKIRKRSLFIR
ncbi:hypothetical protein GOY13_00320 [Wolbachia endosymbiont of Cruorifilaria tuberocauda]|uniref:hypothetical protein n=1 Tax=Wolbachia endosymbiont of Cruorifilaria tuberocauda TaxID=1812111 RepID=UPI0015977F99|nr:hypothetical protein [Wolbachia endosymbiont of Cruorifilaria tuberocauda]QKX01426.1 hypothetical protein GOY13_00320 [Wolbachia endosymbiont of Cruorifilaria tuberocauda]